MNQNYTSSTNLQSSPVPRVISFNRNGFNFHVTMEGNAGTDQHGDKYTLHNGKLYAENSYHVISRYNDVNEEIDEMRERGLA